MQIHIPYIICKRGETTQGEHVTGAKPPQGEHVIGAKPPVTFKPYRYLSPACPVVKIKLLRLAVFFMMPQFCGSLQGFALFHIMALLNFTTEVTVCMQKIMNNDLKNFPYKKITPPPPVSALTVRPLSTGKICTCFT